MQGKIELPVDGIKLYGPKIDGGYNITLSTGGYTRYKVADLIQLDIENILKRGKLKVIIEYDERGYTKLQSDSTVDGIPEYRRAATEPTTSTETNTDGPGKGTGDQVREGDGVLENEVS